MTDLELKKTLNRTRTIDGFSSTLYGTGYTADNVATVSLSGAKVSRIFKNRPFNIERAVSKSKYSITDPRNILYDFKRIIWTWKIEGTYSSTSYTNVLNFVTDCKLLFEDGGTLTLTFQDKTYTILALIATFIHIGGEIHKVDFILELMEGEERS